MFPWSNEEAPTPFDHAFWGNEPSPNVEVDDPNTCPRISINDILMNQGSLGLEKEKGETCMHEDV